MDEQYVMSRRERKKRDRKYAILRAARDLMKERGLNVSVEDIANEADISYPTFFNYYPNKASLYYAIYIEEMEDMREFADIELKEEKRASVRLARLLEALMTDFERYRYLEMCIAGEVVRRDSDESGELLTELFAGEIEAGRASGEFRADISPRHYAMLMTGMMFSIPFYGYHKDDYRAMLDILIKDMTK